MKGSGYALFLHSGYHKFLVMARFVFLAIAQIDCSCNSGFWRNLIIASPCTKSLYIFQVKPKHVPFI